MIERYFSVLADGAECCCRGICSFLLASLDDLHHSVALLFIVSAVGMETHRGIYTEVAQFHLSPTFI